MKCLFDCIYMEKDGEGRVFSYTDYGSQRTQKVINGLRQLQLLGEEMFCLDKTFNKPLGVEQRDKTEAYGVQDKRLQSTLHQKLEQEEHNEILNFQLKES